MNRWSTPEEALLLCADRAFTPNKQEVKELIALLARVERDTAKPLLSALMRAGTIAANFAQQEFAQAQAPLRARLIEILGRAAQKDKSPHLRALLVQSASADPDPTTQRKAIVMLGKLAPAERLPSALEATLMTAFPSAPAPLQRAITEALGKAGSRQALDFLSQQAAPDSESARVQSRATLMLRRTVDRPTSSQIILNSPLPTATRVALLCRSGLQRLLAQEVSGFAKVVRRAPGRVEIDHTGNLQSLLQARTAVEVGLSFALARGNDGDLAERVVRTLSQGAVQKALHTWTRGTVRFRIEWATGGHRRSVTWQLAQRVAEALPEMLNDPVSPAWECRIDDSPTHSEVLFVPRDFTDPRFAYRNADVPAASHPTLAAALALQAAPTPQDTVWDPFLGSGLELIEVAKRSKVRALYGSDTDPNALEAARRNLHAAGIKGINLKVADARTQCVPQASLILSNPPMGRRVARDGALLALLDDFLHNAKDSLAPGGRIVWLSPAPDHTAHTAQSLGYSVERLEPVDLGGFNAELQVLRRPQT